ncbi:adenine specific DNA methylase Mod [Leptospirillum ferriphilum YSK]|uniref:site-specific DNA-methyltransferase (adenine-specific) n=2 Tax=Leptospirillum ferriphilum TaxID=178606 RepID=A0A059XVU2_9BACT|nr:adenine specific DNA methylase Mod [Leptospirillum ferriphilum YSK]
MSAGGGRFGLDWPGKWEAGLEASLPESCSLELVPERSIRPDQAPHLFLEGDNLHILRLLKKEYAGAIGTIYIDPPYNTGTTMRYFDRFSRRGGSSGLAGGDTGSRRDDSPWLSFLYPRLILARELLREDGALFVSIDDRSIHHLRYLLDEIFGPDNHAGTVVWRKKVVRGRGHRHIIPQTEYVVVYARSLRSLPSFSEPLSPEMIDEYRLSDERGPYKRIPLAKTGTAHSPRPNLVYPIEAPDGTLISCPTHQWRWSKETLMARKSELEFVKNRMGKWVVYTRQRLYPDGSLRRKTPVSFYDRVSTSDGTREFRTLCQGALFDFPKPSRLIKDLLGWVPLPVDSQEPLIVLDFFAGTCPTAQAVLELNQSDNGHRKFIMVQDTPAEGQTDIAALGHKRIQSVLSALKKQNTGQNHHGFDNLAYRTMRLSGP